MRKKILMLSLIVGLPIVVILVLLIIVLASMGKNGQLPGPNGNTSSSTTLSSETSISLSPGQLLNYKLGGIRIADTLVLFDDDKSQVVVQFDQRQWKDISWQPKRSVFAVLGNTNTGPEPHDSIIVYNLFIFDPAANRIDQVTTYNQLTSGITGFSWLDEEEIAYTQGETGNTWLHHYDYVNEQITKVFQTEGILVAATAENYVFIESNRYIRWHAANGNLIRRYDTFALADGAHIIQVGLTQQAQPWLLVKSGNNQGLYVLNRTGNEVATSIFNLSANTQTTLGACQLGSQFFVVAAQQNALQIIDIAQSQQLAASLATNQEVTKLSTHVECAANDIYIRVFGGEQNQWYRFRAGRLEQLPLLENLAEIAAL